MTIIHNIADYFPQLLHATLFEGLTATELPNVLRFLGASFRQYQKKEAIRFVQDAVPEAGFVLEGVIESSFLEEQFNKISMNRYQAGDSFLEAFVCADTTQSPIQLWAVTDCVVVILKLDRILNTAVCVCDHQRLLAINLAKILARQNVRTSLKLRIANQKGIRDRVLVHLYSLPADSSGWRTIPFSQTAWAEYLGVNRSALSREIGKMIQDEVIEINGKSIKLCRLLP